MTTETFDLRGLFGSGLCQRLHYLTGTGQSMIRKQRTVLYMDDSPKALRMLTSILEGCGYKVVTACNAGDAFEQIEQTAFDLVLLAYRLPRMISLKLAREIKRLSPGTPVVLLSGYSLFAPEELTYVDAYVGKGATLDNLLTTIRSLTGGR